MTKPEARYCAGEDMWLGHFRASVEGEHTAEVRVGETLVGSITFMVGKPWQEGLGAMKVRSFGPGRTRPRSKPRARATTVMVKAWVQNFARAHVPCISW